MKNPRKTQKNKAMKPEKNKLLAKLHVLKAQLGLDENSYTAFLSSFGVSSAKELPTEQLVRAVLVLEKQLNPDINAIDPVADAWRKRVMASIGAWLKNSGLESDAAHIKAVACRAAGIGQGGFNKIPVSRLRNIYYEFKRKREDSARIDTIKAEQIHYKPSMN